jgi:hypothetical protein
LSSSKLTYFETLYSKFFTQYAAWAMEAHPIPQNVTSFQFKLIGDMTLRQFLYLAAGLLIAYIGFVFLAPSAPFLAWPIISVSALLGVAFAFLPVADRPLDYWLKAYLKAVYSPTKRVWMKNNHSFQTEPLFKTRFATYLSQGISIPQIQPIQAPTPTPAIAQPQQPAKPQAAAPLPTPAELSETVKLARQAQSLQQQIVQTEKHLSQIKNESATGGNPQAYTERLNALLNNLQRLIKETTDIQSQLNKGAVKPIPQTPIKVEVVPPTPKVRVQLVLTSLPNVINGIVLDSVGNYLSDVVVVVRDKGGLPVRALKTNKLGQFTGATPLPNGTYTLEVEKDTFVFDVLKIELEGKVMPALTIAAKKVAGSS